MAAFAQPSHYSEDLFVYPVTHSVLGMNNTNPALFCLFENCLEGGNRSRESLVGKIGSQGPEVPCSKTVRSRSSRRLQDPSTNSYQP